MQTETTHNRILSCLAQGLSYLLHPVLMPVYALLFIFEGGTVFQVVPVLTKLYCLMVTILTLLLLPLASLPLLRHYRLIRDYGLEDRQERVYPILVAVVSAFAGFWLLGLVPFTAIVRQLYLMLVILLSIFSIITLRWKMSMHLSAMGGLCGLVFVLGVKYAPDLRGWMAVLFLLSGLLASCRLYLGRHEPLQVYAGFLFGCCSVAALLF